jgi:hypothetical protein
VSCRCLCSTSAQRRGAGNAELPTKYKEVIAGPMSHVRAAGRRRHDVVVGGGGGTPRSHGVLFFPLPQRTLRTNGRTFDASSSIASGVRRRPALPFLLLRFRIIAPRRRSPKPQVDALLLLHLLQLKMLQLLLKLLHVLLPSALLLLIRIVLPVVGSSSSGGRGAQDVHLLLQLPLLLLVLKERKLVLQVAAPGGDLVRKLIVAPAPSSSSSSPSKGLQVPAQGRCARMGHRGDRLRQTR